MTDGTMRQIERFGGARDTAVVGDRDKDTQGIERRKALGHMKYSNRCVK